jgi:hypothetical protein
MSNIVHMPDRRSCPTVVQTARARCTKLLADLDRLALHLDRSLGAHLEGEAEQRHRQHCETLAHLLREARERAAKI